MINYCIESAEVIIQILESSRPKGVCWLRTGAVINARWMSTILYTCKMLAFNRRMNYSLKFIEQLLNFGIFSPFYIKPWRSATKASDAAYNDFTFYKDTHFFGQNID